MRFAQRRLKGAERLPRGYGFAWLDLDYREAVCYPLLLNWVFAWLRRCYWWLAQGPRDRAAEADRKSWGQGYLQGHQDGSANKGG